MNEKTITQILQVLRTPEMAEARAEFAKLFPMRADDLKSYMLNSKCACGQRMATDMSSDRASTTLLAKTIWGPDTTVPERKPTKAVQRQGDAVVIEGNPAAYTKLISNMPAMSFRGLQVLPMDDGKWLVLFW